MSSRDGRLGVGVIALNPLGPVLASALAGAGHALIGIAVPDDEAEERARAMLPAVPILDEATVVERSELVILASDDEHLPGLIERITTANGWVQGQLVMHTAPSFGTACLSDAFDAGVIPLAVHPAIDVTGTSLDLARLREGWCAVTAPRPVLPIARALVVETGAEPVVIDEADRPAYGDAVTAVTDLTKRLVQQATSTLSGIGIENPGMFLSSLVRSAADSALADATELRLDPDDAFPADAADGAPPTESPE